MIRTNKWNLSGIATRYHSKFENLESFIFQIFQSMVNEWDLAKGNEDSPMLQQNLAWGLGGHWEWSEGATNTRRIIGNAKIANFSLRLSLPALASFRKASEITYHL